MSINRHNYEEYFILYMDNELSSDERRMVETFVQQHPDLKEELDLLLHYKLEPDTSLVFNGKEELLKVNGETPISLANYEEWLVLYTDNELTLPQRKTVEQFAAANPAVKEELALMMRVRLQPEEIVFPFKQSLYRKEEKVRVVPFNWKRLAAAAIIIALGITTVIIINNNKKPSANGNPEIAKVTPVPGKQTNPVTNEQPTNTVGPVVAEKNSNEITNETATTKNIDQSPSPVIKQQEKNIPVKDNKAPVQNNLANNPVPKKDEQVVVEKNNNPIKPSNDLPQPLYNPVINKTNAADVATKDNLSVPTTNQNGSLTNDRVTNDKSDASPIQTVAYLEEGGDNKKSRGLFRKIARTFDKRTNISSPDDDRLLVAGLSFKLK